MSSSSSTQPLLGPSHPAPRPSLRASHDRIQQRTRALLSSRAQHYTILLLVGLDLLFIFADIIINLYQCDTGSSSRGWTLARSYLSIFGLIFSSVFMLELLLNIWAFGWRYFGSWFHALDAGVIVAGFVIDVLLRGVLEEVASLVVGLRLWRFFKIVEEIGVGAEEQMGVLEGRIGELEREIGELRRENGELRREVKRGRGDEEQA